MREHAALHSRSRWRHSSLGAVALAAAPECCRAASGAASVNPCAILLEINGAIGPATSRYFVRGLEAAVARGSRLVILEIDTPGGLDTSMRDIIRAILASPIPVVSYVAPSGARAASAGTYILYASHIAAMAPATNVGAATPVSIGGERSRPRSGARPPKEAPPATPEAGGRRMERKVVNDAAAYPQALRSCAAATPQWAEQAVRGAASLSATAALKEHVIDLIARDIPDLLAQLDGREVRIGRSRA